MSANPWLVENIQEFSFLNCPECAFKVKEEDKFQDHAVRNHSQSSALFGHNAKSEFITVKTKPRSEISSEDFKCVLSSNVDEITGFKITIDDQKTNLLGSISPRKEKPLEELIEIITSTSAPDNSISTSKVQNSNKQDLDIGIKHNEIGENSLVDKVITNVKTDNVRITPKILKIIPMEKFPKKDKTTSIFKCQIPPKKIPKPTKADEHHSNQEKLKASTSTIQKRKGPSDQSSNNTKRTKVQLESRKDLKCNFCSFSTSERSELALHVGKKHLSINSDNDEICLEPFKDELSSNVDDEITLHKEQKIDPLAGISPKTGRTFEELIFLEPELPDPDKEIPCKVRKDTSLSKPDEDTGTKKLDLIVCNPDKEEFLNTLVETPMTICDTKNEEEIEHNGNLIEQQTETNPLNLDENSISKPYMSYAQLIAEALNNAPEQSLVLSDIYKAINAKYPYYKLETRGWQQGISSRLTSDKYFIKIKGKLLDKPKHRSYWKLSKDIPKSLLEKVKPKKSLSESIEDTECNENIIDKQSVTDPLNLDDNNMENSGSKPYMSYAQLIAEALNNAPEQTLILPDIYKAINAKYPYYKLKSQGWQNSIKHYLTYKNRNKNFIKGKPFDEHSWYWKLSKDVPKSLLAKRKSEKRRLRLLASISKEKNKCNENIIDHKSATDPLNLDDNNIENSGSKPYMSYPQLIAEAINNGPEQTLILSDIYKAINAKYPYYKLKTQGWQNSIRHYLTYKNKDKNFIKGKPFDEVSWYWKLSKDVPKSLLAKTKSEKRRLLGNKTDNHTQGVST